MPQFKQNVARLYGMRRTLLLSAALAAAVSAFPAAARAEQPPAARLTGEQVRAAILRSVEAFKRTQKPDGSWPDYAQEGGVTALAAYALLQAGVAPDEKGMAAALEHLRKVADRSTYVVALKALAFASADSPPPPKPGAAAPEPPRKFARPLQDGVDWLVKMQNAGGGWGYGQVIAASPPGGEVLAPTAASEAALKRAYERPDLSNTQFAILALSEAERAGANVPPEVWSKADQYVRASQLPGGGWGYVYHDLDPDEAYGSMTGAAVASLYLCGDRLAGREAADVTAKRLSAIQKGLDWLAQHFTLSENPNRALSWYYFWVYAMERAGVTSGRRMFGDHDWFREGGALLVGGQRADGTWTDHLYDDALCLLFLSKGYKPVLVQRLMWGGQWRQDPRDLDHLVRYLDRRIGGQPVAWQTLSGDAPLADYLAAPILHVAGRGQLRMLAGSLLKLRQYVEQGGLILFDAEGGDAVFLDSVRQILTEQFPESKLEPLPIDHPIATVFYKLKPEGLEVMNIGCRAAIIVATKGLAEKMAAEDPAKPNAPALDLAENLAVYATGAAALPDRLQPATIISMPPDAEPPPNAYRIGQVQHAADWNPRPYAMPLLLKELATRFGAAVFSRPAPVRLTDANLGSFSMLYLTGHYALRLSDAEKAALRQYMDRGDRVVFAEDCCGRAAFDKSLRDLMKELFPDSTLEELPADHPIFSGKVGRAIPSVTYSPAVQAESPDLKRPVLLGLVRGGHLVLVYSPYGLAVGMDGLKSYGARTLSPEDARQLAINIMLYLMH
jgi:hypothetical protein